MKIASKTLILLGIALTLIALVSAAVYHEPWSHNQEGNQHNLTDMNYVSAEYFEIGDGYIYDNGTTLIIGRS